MLMTFNSTANQNIIVWLINYILAMNFFINSYKWLIISLFQWLTIKWTVVYNGTWFLFTKSLSNLHVVVPHTV